MHTILVLVATLTACIPSLDLTKVPEQDRAVGIVWRDVYQDHLALPLISWVRPPHLDCEDGTGFVDELGTCLWGETYFYRVIRVALRSDLISGTSFAHELLHVHLQDEFDDLDSSHSRPEWQPGGLLEEANDTLRANGL